MVRISAVAAVAAIAMSMSPAGSFAQSARRHTFRGFAASARHKQRGHRSILRLRHEYRTGCDNGFDGIAGDWDGVHAAAEPRCCDQ